MVDNKYIVFKREMFNDLVGTQAKHIEETGAIPDATVIRSQDLFAAPALFAYANSIAVAINILENTNVDSIVMENLKNVADYFFERAVEAEATEHRKLPD